jgi:hypothetical protein
VENLPFRSTAVDILCDTLHSVYVTLGRTIHSNVNSDHQTVQRFRQRFDVLLRDFDRGTNLSTFALLTQSDGAIRDILDKLQDTQAREDRKGDQ